MCYPVAPQRKICFPCMCPSPRLSSVAEDTIRAYFESRLVLLEPVFPLACHRLCEGPDFSMEFGFKSQPQPEGKTPAYLCKRASSPPHKAEKMVACTAAVGCVVMQRTVHLEAFLASVTPPTYQFTLIPEILLFICFEGIIWYLSGQIIGISLDKSAEPTLLLICIPCNVIPTMPPSPPAVPGSGILLFIFHANFLNEITARLCGPCSVHAVVLNDKFQLPIFLVGSKSHDSQTEDVFNT